MQAQSNPPVQRKYALTKVKTGDYLLPSNNGQDIWRIATYTEGPSTGIEGMTKDETFWGLWLWNDKLSEGYVDTQDWNRWEYWAGWFETRNEAIQAALHESEMREEP